MGSAQPLRLAWRGLGDRPELIDRALVVLLGAVVVATSATHAHAAVVVPAGSVMALTVAFRRRTPVAATLVGLTMASVIDRWGGSNLVISPVVIALNYYTVGRRRSERGWSWSDAFLLALPLPGIATDPSTGSPGNPLVIDIVSVWGFFCVLPFAAGRVISLRTSMNAALRENVARLEHERRERARQAVLEERTRIARELHDVVAHSVSVMVIQTAAARRVARRDPARAAEAMRSVESCGRDALVDMRRMVGVLRRADIDLLGGAAPGLAQLDRLADRARASGLPVDVTVRGDARPLAAALDLVAFRVVQEALTNSMKHAGSARAGVTVTFTPTALELEIVDTGAGARPERKDAAPPGHGLIGMQERLSLYGGQLRTGSRRSGGFTVTASIPLTPAASA